MSAKKANKEQYVDKTASQQSKHITNLLRTIYKSINGPDLAKSLNKLSRPNKLGLSHIKDIVYEKKDIEYINNYCLRT